MKSYKVFFISQFNDVYRRLQKIFNNTLGELKKKDIMIELLMTDNLDISDVTRGIFRLIQEADLVVCNIYGNGANTLYEVGIAHALNKPTILLVDYNAIMKIDPLNYRYITYDPENIDNNLTEVLTDTIIDALKSPDEWKILTSNTKRKKEYKTVFVSYSHKDLLYLDRLKIHLKPLERKSLIQLWSDTIIQSGDKWKKEIENALNKSAIAVLLISADFLASDFIVNNELQPLLKNAEQKGTIVIPVIIKPCRFLREPSISQFQAVNDPLLPLCKLSEYEQEEIFEKISHRIEVELDSEK